MASSQAAEQWRLYRQDGHALTLIRDFDSLCEAAQCIAQIEQVTAKTLTFEMTVPLDLERFGIEPLQMMYREGRVSYVVVKT